MAKVNIYEERPEWTEPVCSVCGHEMNKQVTRVRKKRSLKYWICLFAFALIGWLRDKKENTEINLVCPECGNMITAEELDKMRTQLEKDQKAWDKAVKRHERIQSVKNKINND